MLKKRLLFYILISIFLWPPIVTMAADNHIRVVLDISGSLTKTDPGRLAILSTILLYDLSRPNPTLGDSFKVIPFDEGRNWKWKNQPLESKRTAITVMPGEPRDKFVKALNSLKYNGHYTYFYPGLYRAIEDLKNIPENKSNVKTIILVTDGLPDKNTRKLEAQLIRDNLIPLIEKHKIQLYILAFGTEAYKNQEFFENMITSSDGLNRLGEFLIDEKGDDLLFHMIKIFSYNFGFTYETPKTLPNVRQLDLEGGLVPSRVAVIVYSNNKYPVNPSLKLSPPPKGKLNTPDSVQTAKEKGGRYSLQWVLSPDKGKYGLKTNVSQGSVAILRPGNVQLQVLPAPPDSTQTDWALAGKKLHLKVLVKSLTGAKGDPGEIKLSYTPFGENIPDPLGETMAPPPGSSQVRPEGRIYDIIVHFPKNPKNPQKDYVGYLQLQAHRGQALVGSLKHRMIVKASGIFYYTGAPINLNLGTIGVDRISCKQIKFKTKPQRQGEVNFELKSVKWLPLGHSLQVRVIPSSRVLKPNGSSLSVTPNEQFEVCLKTEEDVGSSVAQGEKWLELRVKGSNKREHRVDIQLNWQVIGLTFWQRWGWLILSILAILSLLFIVLGFVTPQRFSGSLALVFVPERDELDEQSPLPIKQWKGIGSGFYRNARAFLHPDYRLSNKPLGALAALYAETGGTRVIGTSSPLYRETLDGDWETVIEQGRRTRPGDIFRIGDNGPYFRIAARGK